MFVRSFWLLYYLRTHTQTIDVLTVVDVWPFQPIWIHSRSWQGRLCQCVMYWLKQGDNEIVCAWWKCIHWVHEFGLSYALCVWCVTCFHNHSSKTGWLKKLLVQAEIHSLSKWICTVKCLSFFVMSDYKFSFHKSSISTKASHKIITHHLHIQEVYS